MEITVKHSEVKKTITNLVQGGYFFVSGYGNDMVYLKFDKRTREETQKLFESSDIVDILKGMYGNNASRLVD